MAVLVIVLAALVLVILWFVIVSMRDRRHGYRLRSADDMSAQLREARDAIRESEDRWHQEQPFGRRARRGDGAQGHSSKYPWLG